MSVYVTLPAAQAVVLSSNGLLKYTTGMPLTVPVALSTELPAGTAWAKPSTMSRTVVWPSVTLTGPVVPWVCVVSPAGGFAVSW